MNIKECYDKAGANYEDALNRLGSDMLVECFALKFLQDDSFKQLTDGLAEKDGEKAFRGARTLKGVCVNLGFDNLYEVSSELTEQLCGREIEGFQEMYDKVEECYNKVIAALQEMADQSE